MVAATLAEDVGCSVADVSFTSDRLDGDVSDFFTDEPFASVWLGEGVKNFFPDKLFPLSGLEGGIGSVFTNAVNLATSSCCFWCTFDFGVSDLDDN